MAVMEKTHKARRLILEFIRDHRPVSIKEICINFNGLSRYNVSNHLSWLRTSGVIVTCGPQGHASKWATNRMAKENRLID